MTSLLSSSFVVVRHEGIWARHTQRRTACMQCNMSAVLHTCHRFKCRRSTGDVTCCARLIMTAHYDSRSIGPVRRVSRSAQRIRVSSDPGPCPCCTCRCGEWGPTVALGRRVLYQGRHDAIGFTSFRWSRVGDCMQTLSSTSGSPAT